MKKHSRRSWPPKGSYPHPAGGYIIHGKAKPGDRIRVIGHLKEEPGSDKLSNVAPCLDPSSAEVFRHSAAVDLDFSHQLPHTHSGLVLRYEFVNLIGPQPSLDLRSFDNEWRAGVCLTVQDRFCQV